ncbi:YcxB family protein [Caldisericum sp.]|uniref:YcxB family protein n=1 Tax=Caldisericum sp. TaxID=2499687 RepID=UPI003D13FA72
MNFKCLKNRQENWHTFFRVTQTPRYIILHTQSSHFFTIPKFLFLFSLTKCKNRAKVRN